MHPDHGDRVGHRELDHVRQVVLALNIVVVEAGEPPAQAPGVLGPLWVFWVGGLGALIAPIRT